MPLYDYHCASCGDFRSWRRMNELDDELCCPDCAQVATRRVVAPSLATMPAARRLAQSRNEKSAHEPRLVTKSDQGSGEGGGHAHGHGHGPSRPWMIGH